MDDSERGYVEGWNAALDAVAAAAPAPVEPPPAVAGIDWDAERDRCAFPSYKE
jgi:hypothetical protein